MIRLITSQVSKSYIFSSLNVNANLAGVTTQVNINTKVIKVSQFYLKQLSGENINGGRIILSSRFWIR